MNNSNYKTNKTQTNLDWSCGSCGVSERLTEIKIISTSKSADCPRLTLQIKEACYRCDAFVRLALQTEMLVNQFNTYLGKAYLVRSKK
jgi:hypothetical protein